jgi:hypothetical protein
MCTHEVVKKSGTLTTTSVIPVNMLQLCIGDRFECACDFSSLQLGGHPAWQSQRAADADYIHAALSSGGYYQLFTDCKGRAKFLDIWTVWLKSVAV